MYRLGLFPALSTYLTAVLPHAGYEWSRSSPLRSSPDTSSSMYPDRPIRPLPRRSLRDRLSPEQADTIEFPSNPPSTGPLFNFPYSASERGSRSLRTGENDHHACHCGHTHSEVESEEDDERTGPIPASPSYQYSRRPAKPVTSVAGAHRKPGSAASSVDGYESFENTNNKKKRKIPNMHAGSNGAHHAALSADLASMGIAQAHEADALDDDGPGRYYGSAPATPQQTPTSVSAGAGAGTNTGTGISGAGRGRFGRSGSGRSERRVLANSTNLVNAKASSKRTVAPRDLACCTPLLSPCANDVFSLGPPEASGIISTAIANAQATPPPPGNENVSLLQQEAAKHSANKTQFTFTCGSDSANKMVWPGQENQPYPQPPGAYPSAAAPPHAQPARPRPPVRPDVPTVLTQGTQTSPRMNGTHPPPANRGLPHPPLPKGSQPPPPQQAPLPPKPKRSVAKLYKHAARKRQIQQEYANFHNPPANPWICEFCEFEGIFGYKPKALIRQYERKDRQERKRLAEKRRLLEKARQKGRKGKKASKKAQANANNAHHAQNPPPGGYDHRADDGSLDPQDDEYYDDDDDGYDRPPAHPCCHHECHHLPHPPPQNVPGIPPGDPRLATNGA
jgi:hypothetical protein